MIDLAIDTRVFLNTTLDVAIQELDMIFNTSNGELIGYPEYGTNFEQFLWQLNDATDKLREYIYEKIRDSYFLKDMLVDVDINTIEGEMRKIYVVKIIVGDGKNAQQRVYQLR